MSLIKGTEIGIYRYVQYIKQQSKDKYETKYSWTDCPILTGQKNINPAEKDRNHPLTSDVTWMNAMNHVVSIRPG